MSDSHSQDIPADEYHTLARTVTTPAGDDSGPCRQTRQPFGSVVPDAPPGTNPYPAEIARLRSARRAGPAPQLATGPVQVERRASNSGGS
ncbi:hypothetical protein GCM10022255_075080 [Dactylosporangium darangshiense]|uniref:Uncharacterized protein n=1 Tax=Dactylosporangium darangshiense TaxID=579108 RepID=A0ABP8DJN8_9ACTN